MGNVIPLSIRNDLWKNHWSLSDISQHESLLFVKKKDTSDASDWCNKSGELTYLTPA